MVLAFENSATCLRTLKYANVIELVIELVEKVAHMCACAWISDTIVLDECQQDPV